MQYRNLTSGKDAVDAGKVTTEAAAEEAKGEEAAAAGEEGKKGENEG